jgi:hypothetical protein
MMEQKTSNAALLEQIEKDMAAKPPADKLEFIRDKIREVRDIEFKIADLENHISELNQTKRNLIFDALPTMFMQVGLNRLEIAAQGNLPAYEAKLNDHYHAVIKSDWPSNQRKAALQWVRKHKLGDIIKTTLTIELGLGQDKLLKKVLAALTKLGVVPTIEETVPWKTLTAVVKERFQDGKPLSDKDLTTLGATVSKMVKLNPVKEK